MASFKCLFDEIGKTPDLPVDWVGNLYKCEVMVQKVELGRQGLLQHVVQGSIPSAPMLSSSAALMACFKCLFDEIGKTPDLPADWVGNVYKCKVMVQKGEGSAPAMCGTLVKSKHSSTNGLRNHVCDHHPLEYQRVLESAGSIKAYFPSDRDEQQRRNIVLSWAENALPCALLDFPSF